MPLIYNPHADTLEIIGPCRHSDQRVEQLPHLREKTRGGNRSDQIELTPGSAIADDVETTQCHDERGYGHDRYPQVSSVDRRALFVDQEHGRKRLG